jgi:hypothetical protein
MTRTCETANNSLRRANSTATAACIFAGAVGMVLMTVLPASGQASSAQVPAGTVLTLSDAGQISDVVTALPERSRFEVTTDQNKIPPTETSPATTQAAGAVSEKERPSSSAVTEPPAGRTGRPPVPAYDINHAAQVGPSHRALSTPRGRAIVREVRAILRDRR